MTLEQTGLLLGLVVGSITLLIWAVHLIRRIRRVLLQQQADFQKYLDALRPAVGTAGARTDWGLFLIQQSIALGQLQSWTQYMVVLFLIAMFGLSYIAIEFPHSVWERVVLICLTSYASLSVLVFHCLQWRIGNRLDKVRKRVNEMWSSVLSDHVRRAENKSSRERGDSGSDQ